MSDSLNLPEDKFQDPLENYDPPEYNDSLEQALAEEPSTAIQSTPFVTIAADTPLFRALQTLAGLEIACLLVTEGKKLVGLFTVRDILDKVADQFAEIKDLPVREFMTTDPVVVYDVDPAAVALCVMASSGYRHVPVLNMEEEIVGVVSPNRIMEFFQQNFDKE